MGGIRRGGWWRGVWHRWGLAAEVAIHIEKRLPVQGGMGAGSANAAAALLGLERELGVALPGVERLELAAEVGSDVPLFLLGGAVLGTGRGELVVRDAGFAADLVCGGGAGGGGFVRRRLSRRGMRWWRGGIREYEQYRDTEASSDSGLTTLAWEGTEAAG